MSNEVNNLAHSFVAMAQAYERLPQVQADLAHANDCISDYAAQVQRLELRLIDAANEADAILEALRKAEEARDEATQAFLEADDRTERALDVVRSLMGNAGSFLKTLEPAAVMAEPTPAAADVVQDTAGIKVDASERSIDLDPGPAIGTLYGDFDFYGDPTNIDSVSVAAPEVAASTDPMLATASSSENVWPGLQGAPQALEPGQSDASPTAPSGDGNTPLLDTVATGDVASATDAPAEPVDDVGYHNEPETHDGGTLYWNEWHKWGERMNQRYGSNGWPIRYKTATQ